MAPPAVSIEEHEAALAEIADLRERIEELQAEEGGNGESTLTVAVDLEAELEQAQSAVLDCQALAFDSVANERRSREGLERCVDELNRVAAEGARVRLPAIPARPPRRLSPVRTLATPRVQLAGEQAIVSARLWNPAEEDQNVRVEVALLVDGEVRESEVQRLLVPAGGDHAVAATFSWRGGVGTLSGRVRVLE